MPKFPCTEDGCDRVFDKKQGLVMHKRVKHPTPYVEPTFTDEELSAAEGIDVTSNVIEADDGFIAPTLSIVPEPEVEVIIDPPDSSSRRDPLDIDAQAWNPDAAARRAKAARLGTMTVVTDDAIAEKLARLQAAHPSNPEWEPTPEDQAMAAHGAAITEVVKEMHQAATGIELTRRHYGYVQSRCREGFPDAMDVRYLLSLVDMADGMLQILAQPHVLMGWEKALHE